MHRMDFVRAFHLVRPSIMADVQPLVAAGMPDFSGIITQCAFPSEQCVHQSGTSACLDRRRALWLSARMVRFNVARIDQTAHIRWLPVRWQINSHTQTLGEILMMFAFLYPKEEEAFKSCHSLPISAWVWDGDRKGDRYGDREGDRDDGLLCSMAISRSVSIFPVGLQSVVYSLYDIRSNLFANHFVCEESMNHGIYWMPIDSQVAT